MKRPDSRRDRRGIRLLANGGSDPTWQDQVAALFSEPYWIVPSQRTATGRMWLGCMTGFGIQLDDYDNVKGGSRLIYDYLASQDMPLGEAAWPGWPGFAPHLAWAKRGWVPAAARKPVTASSSCSDV